MLLSTIVLSNRLHILRLTHSLFVFRLRLSGGTTVDLGTIYWKRVLLGGFLSEAAVMAVLSIVSFVARLLTGYLSGVIAARVG